MSDNSHKKCWLPWRMFRIMSDGDITICCSNRSVIGNISRNSFEEIWNSENAVNFRSLVAEGRYIEAGCATCAFWYTFNNYLFDFPESEVSLTSVQAANRHIQLDEYRRSKTRLVSKPSMFFIQPSYLCNLNCIMCNQKHVRKEKGTLAVVPDLMSFLDDFDPVIENVILQGGEPLLVEEILAFLEKVASGRGNHFVTLNTNGLLFHVHEDMLKRIRRLKINFSVDAGSGDVYGRIRAGGDWSRLVDNIDKAVKISRQGDNAWSVNIQNLIMKSNIDHVYEMVLFWAEKAPSQKIYPILGADNGTENIFIYNHLLEQVPNWSESLDKALNLAAVQGFEELGLGLKYCKELLECAPLLTGEIHKLLSMSMDEGEYINYFNNMALYKIARINGFANKEYFNYMRLRHFGFQNERGHGVSHGG